MILICLQLLSCPVCRFSRCAGSCILTVCLAVPLCVCVCSGQPQSSGPVTKLVLEGRGAVAAWRKLIGPTDPEAAKDPEGESYAPECLRAKYGTDATNNALHGSQSSAAAVVEEGVLFKAEISAEDAACPTEKTYAMIKPDAVAAGSVDAIVLMAENNGFTIVQRVDTEEPLPEDIVKEFYVRNPALYTALYSALHSTLRCTATLLYAAESGLSTLHYALCCNLHYTLHCSDRLHQTIPHHYSRTGFISLTRVCYCFAAAHTGRARGQGLL